MKAAQLVHYGGQDSIRINEVEKPRPGAGEVLVALQAAGVNPFDWKLRDGQFQATIDLHLPATLGGDFAGVVTELGEGVTDTNVGQAVFGQANAVSGQGSWAEFSSVKAQSLAPKPTALDFASAAAVPLVGVSAYQALVETMRLQPGQKILIHGGAGGIGSMAIQFAKHLAAEVTTTVSKKDVDFASACGADRVINYEMEDFSKLLQGYDAVYDTVGGVINQKSYQVLKPGSWLVSMVTPVDEALMKQYKINVNYQQTRITPERLSAVAKLFDQGVLKVHIDKVFPLDQAGAALEYLKTGRPRGKIVLTVAS